MSRPGFEILLHPLFDEKGRERPRARLSASHLLTPTGLPIEAHGEMTAEPRPGGRRVWHSGLSCLVVPGEIERGGTWRRRGTVASVSCKVRFRVPRTATPGHWGIRVEGFGVGEPEFDAGEPAGHPACVAFLRIGDPKPPRLAALLLGSAGSDGSRGVIAREDRNVYALNPRNVFSPAKRILPRDDAYSGKPIRYPLDPYLPLLSLTDRPWPVIPDSLVPFDFGASTLTVTVTGPNGKNTVLGPAPLSEGRNDLSVLRPDRVVRDRKVPPLPPAYGNPSLADMFHLSGRGAFDHAFSEYGHHEIRLEGRIRDRWGTTYGVSGTYDVHVARPLDFDVFPEPGTPLVPGAGIPPQIRIPPSVPAEVEIEWRHFPHSDASRMVRRVVSGRANRWGVFVPGPDTEPVTFREPGEYVMDATVRYRDGNGVLWMGSRRGASVVVTPGSKIVVHGERGNRCPTANWRARWFVADAGGFVASPAPEADPDRPAVDLGHTCYPYEPGDVAWLGAHDPFSLFPNLTFEDPEGTIAGKILERWPGVRRGEGREGLYPHHLLPEDRLAQGELPFVCMTASGLPPTVAPEDVDLWGYFYTTSWRPGVPVRSQVSEDTLPAGYWFFDDPYGW
ncbi:MAG: hypothetical protein ACYS47_21875, partial [Planctomycetota bacterium]